jgi:hypothetical protein
MYIKKSHIHKKKLLYIKIYFWLHLHLKIIGLALDRGALSLR